MDKNRSDKIIFCRRCGSRNPSDSNFCENCGLRLKTTSVTYTLAESTKHKANVWILVVILLLLLNTILFFWYSYQLSNYHYKYIMLENRYQSLEQDYDMLKESYSSLKQERRDLEEWYNSIKSQINLRILEEDRKIFVTPTDPTISNLVTQITGGWSSTINLEEYWNDLKKMYDWVIENIVYSYDSPYPLMPEARGKILWVDEVWRFPNETIRSRCGDCEDQALLLASMIRNYGEKKYDVWVIRWTSRSSTHLAVAVPVEGGELAILDPAGHFYTNDRGIFTHKDAGLAVEEWINHWRIQQTNINTLLIDLAFSDTDYQKFSSTNEFVEWVSVSKNPSPPRSYFLIYERIEIRSAYSEPESTGWKVCINILNTGSKFVKIDNIFLNNIPYSDWGATLDVTLPISVNVGAGKSFCIHIPASATYGNQKMKIGTVILIKLHSTSNKEYFTSVVLP